MLNRLADRVFVRAYEDTMLQPVRAIGTAGTGAPHDYAVGDEVRARIASVLPGGIFRVLIEDQALMLRLPCNAQAGDVLQLTVTAREPQLKFALAEQPGAPAQAPRISEIARFITALLAESEKLPLATGTLFGAPLIHGPPHTSAALATALHGALAASGIFYESHQAQWVNGERPLNLLLNEPQARLPPLAPAAGVPSGADNAPAHPDAPALPVHRDALAIVRQQLDTLDTRHVTWQGLVWHDQPLEWQISEAPHPAADAPEVPWQTRIKLTLPTLGAVEATLVLEKRGLAISLHAALADTAQALAAGRDNLQQALCAAHLNPLAITINTHDAP